MSDEVSDILEKNLGETMLVSLKNRGRLKGRIDGFDEHLNLVLNNAEYSGHASHLKKLGSIILRGDNIVTISSVRKQGASKRKTAWKKKR